MFIQSHLIIHQPARIICSKQVDYYDSKEAGHSISRARPCYLCGKKFGTASFEIHLERCKELWTAREEKKWKEDRRALPIPPADLDPEPWNLNGDALEGYNNLAFDVYNKASLVKCPGCTRTFNEESLPRHMKSCCPEGAPEKESVLDKMAKRPKFLICYICGQLSLFIGRDYFVLNFALGKTQDRDLVCSGFRLSGLHGIVSD